MGQQTLAHSIYPSSSIIKWVNKTFAHSIEPWDESTIMQHIDNWLHDRAMGKHCMDLSFALHDRAIVTIGKMRLTYIQATRVNHGVTLASILSINPGILTLRENAE